MDDKQFTELDGAEKYRLTWPIDTDYCHHGIPLSNGNFGGLIWFNQNRIMITLNRADYWDHRGGLEWDEACSYENLKKLLHQKRFDEIKHIYRKQEYQGKGISPSRLPMGRFEVVLKEGVVVKSAMLDLLRAEAEMICSYGEEMFTITASILMDRPVLVMKIDDGIVDTIEAKPSYTFEAVKSYFQDFGIPDGIKVNDPQRVGWIQELPNDPACAVIVGKGNGTRLFTSEYGNQAEAALSNATELIRYCQQQTYNQLTEAVKKAWERLWDLTADIYFSDSESLQLYYLGIYKMLGNSMPGGIVPSLQGPWVEEFRMPPWQGDHHFNINVQECLWPAYGANLLDCLHPLFEMLERIKPKLEGNAKSFVQIDDGYMINHATDDRGTCIGGFWTGNIDHANTSWIAQLMWQYYAYSLEDFFLKETLYPFMKRTMNVYLQMLEKVETGYVLPVSISPEYGGDNENAWGENSSFFLANIHFLLEKIIDSVEHRGVDDTSYAVRMKQLQQELPLYTTGPSYFGEEIYLWKDQALSISHRHHSHLAGIYPFDVIDVDDEAHRAIVQNSYKSWTSAGMGGWTGWSMPWASILHARLGNGNMAYLCLKLFSEVFLDKGYASRHNAKFPGFTRVSGGDLMQVEAGTAYAASVLEMFVQCVRGQIRVFPALPNRFAAASFRGIRAEGAFLISGRRLGGRTEYVEIYSEKGAVLNLKNPFGENARIERGGSVMKCGDPVIVLETNPGERLSIYRNS